MSRSTHTYATLEVSAEAYDEIKRLLTDAGYQHALQDDLIDMQGIALERGPEKPCDLERKTRDGLTRCRSTYGARQCQWPDGHAGNHQNVAGEVWPNV